ncbi:MAG: 4-hydroxythreonine-4-phosphate dehydrogenase [Myxococcota bacterium]|jgi:4-hydroxythreonine-4-phosphate dehydrogenase
MDSSAPLVVTPGMGIGPEVTAHALSTAPPTRPVVLLGDPAPIRAAAAAVGLHLPLIHALSEAAAGVSLLVPTTLPGEAVEVAAIRQAAQACLSSAAAAMVTGPIHKKRLSEQGFAFSGHTDFLGALCGAPPVMAFVGGKLRVALVTTHIPLMKVGAALNVSDIVRVVATSHDALVHDLGLLAPRVAVCGLNPHAGEEGLLGSEELTVIGPACEQLRRTGRDVWGPVSAETAFLEAQHGRVDLVVAMYHDQGLAPLKAVDFGRSVNWTLGLPIIRTSVDHGTADHLVGTGQAEPDSMIAALRLAEEILQRRALR